MAPGHEDLAGELLFRRAAKEDQGSGEVFGLHFRLDAHSGRHIGPSHQAVAAAMTAALALYRLFVGDRFLAQARKWSYSANRAITGEPEP